MMLTLIPALLLVGRQDSLQWPIVPGSQFAVNGITSEGSVKLEHVNVNFQPNGKTVIKRQSATGDSASVVVPGKMSAWKTLQIAFTTRGDGTLARFGRIALIIRKNHLFYAKDGKAIKVAPLIEGDLNDVQVIRHFDSIIAFVNGSRVVPSVIPTAPVMPIEIGVDGWKGSIIGTAAYTRELTVDELYANEQAAKAIAKALFADTKQATVEVELLAMTPVPELEKIRPYRSALLAEEYKVVRVVSGRMSSLKPGMKIRIFRYGIRAGDKTELKDTKLGDRSQIPIQSYDSDPKFSREFQVDALDPDISIPLFVDVSPAK